jgi:integrase
MFLKFLGANRKARTLSRRDWDRFINERRSGVVGRAVGNRMIAYDLKWLLSVLNWAALAGDGRGGMLLDRNPLRGLPLPKEENPKRPMAFQESYEAMLKVADSVDPRFGLALVLANETGHRIGSIRQLRWSDVDLREKRITWRAENDKLGKQHVTPLSDAALAAFEAERKKNPAVGEAWIFPAPGNVDRPERPPEPVSRHLVRDWWERAETLAELAHESRMGWHSLRRKFATELKTKPLKDLCALGGWKGPQTLFMCYQREDEGTMREALATRKALRAATGS